MKLLNYMRLKLGGVFRPLRNFFARRIFSRYHSSVPTIISQNCIGGVMYHDLGLRFNSPTINCYMSASDFIKFCEHLSYYLAIDANIIHFVDSAEDYPIGFLDDIKIYFVHYSHQKDVVEKWNRRRLRVDYNNIYLVLTDRDGFNDSLLSKYDQLPYKKVLFTHKKNKLDCDIYMPCFKKEQSVGGLTSYCSIFGKRYYAKYFNYISWLGNKFK